MKLWLKILLGVLLLLVFVFLTTLFPPAFYLPHEKPTLILPIDPKYDSFCNIMPMGEKIAHPNTPLGHPGIDFGFGGITEGIPYIVSMDGKISSVKIYSTNEKEDEKVKPISKKMANVVIKNGPYQVVYTEMDAESLPPTTKVGVKVKRGDFIGFGNYMDKGTGPGTKSEMIHWEFGSTSPLIDRFCPLSYFTEESRRRIEKIWERTEIPQMKPLYPKICNGGYDGKVER